MKTMLLISDSSEPLRVRKWLTHLTEHGHDEAAVLVLGPPVETISAPGGLRFFDREEKFQYLSSRSADLARLAGQDSQPSLAAGLLRAWEDGAERVVLSGPGCQPAAADVLAGHAIAGQAAELAQWEGERGWMNTAKFWRTEGEQSFYPRGFPLEHRGGAAARCHVRAARVMASVGVCLGEADVDAITSLERRVVVSGLGPDAASAVPVLAPGTWSSFSADNLALSWEALPAYFVCPNLGNYAAVWASFLLQRIAGHLGRVIGFGGPAVQRSAAGNPWQELDAERPGLRRSGELARALRSLSLQGASAVACVGEIARDLPKAWPAGSLRGAQAWSGYEIEWRRRFLEGLTAWAEALDRVRAASPTRTSLGESVELAPSPADAIRA